MKRKTKIILFAVLGLVAIANLPPLAFFFRENYSYRNKDGSFKYQEQSGKSLDYEVCKIRFQRFKIENPGNPNKTLYRTFSLKPWRFWEWSQMIFNYERFTLPYYNKEYQSLER
ncbi:hypothetical protein [Pedobacter jeongneungensis]|uniref:hypothetical protein n=1 Tax=Pedobacter jeongneungensis TaxID=947309 RepID=UPI000468B78F|nr:hypothetical protein [Pedobacter jeongneungensis]